MRHVFLLLICFITVSNFAQESDLYKKATNDFQENFNTQNIEAIFNLYTAEMQEAMTKEGISRFVNGCFEQFGNLKSLTFIETNEGVHSYTAEFNKINLLMELQLSDEGKISTIQFQEP